MRSNNLAGGETGNYSFAKKEKCGYFDVIGVESANRNGKNSRRHSPKAKRFIDSGQWLHRNTLVVLGVGTRNGRADQIRNKDFIECKIPSRSQFKIKISPKSIFFKSKYGTRISIFLWIYEGMLFRTCIIFLQRQLIDIKA